MQFFTKFSIKKMQPLAKRNDKEGIKNFVAVNFGAVTETQSCYVSFLLYCITSMSASLYIPK